MASVKLVPVDEENYIDVCLMDEGELPDDYEGPLDPPNWDFVIRSLFHSDLFSMAITNESGRPVGFLAYGFYDFAGPEEEAEDVRLEISHIMIDEEFKDMGYMKEALSDLLKKLRSDYPGSIIHKCIVRDKQATLELYGSFGFKETGEETVYGYEVLALNP